MQPVDPSQLLKVLESPMGAAMLPQLAQQQGMAMDQGRAALADTIARTGIAQDGNRRSNEMHPLEMDSRRTQTAGQELENQGRQFTQGVKDKLGQDHFVKEAQLKLSADQQKQAQDLQKGFAGTAAIVKGLPADSPPGLRRQAAVEAAKRMQLDPAVIDSISKWPEETIGPRLYEMAEDMAKLSRQAVQENIKQDGALSREFMRGEYGLRRQEVANDGKLKAAAIAAAARIKSAGGKDPKNFKTFEEASVYYSGLAFRLPPGPQRDDAEIAATYYANQVDTKPPTSGATQSTIGNVNGKPAIVQQSKNLPPPGLPKTSAPLPDRNPAQNAAPTKENAAKIPQPAAQPKPSYRFENGKLVPVN